MRKTMMVLGSALALAFAAPVAAAPPSLPQFLSYRFVGKIVAADHGDRIAWIETIKGIRNIWVASGPGYVPRQLTHYDEDDGQELTQLAFDPSGEHLVYVRGGDHDGNWPAEGGLAPDPTAATEQPVVTIWALSFAGGGPPLKLAEGDAPAVSPQGRVAYIKDDQIWATSLDATAKPEKLVFDRGKDRDLLWSPDGSRLAFVSGRGDHAFITVYTPGKADLTYVAPSTGRDDDPVWSPDGKRIAFTRQPGDGGAPEPLLVTTPRPFAIWTADATTGEGAAAWRSAVTLDGSYPGDGDGVGLRWMAGDTLAFITTLDGWEHLYAMPAKGGTPRLLTPGKFMVEHVAPTQDKTALLYAANTGTTAGDDDRRHVYRVALGGGAPVALSAGTGSEWYPAPAGKGVAMIASDPRHPAAVVLADGKALRPIEQTDYPSEGLVTPTLVHFTAPDGLPIEGQLFSPVTKGPHPALVFVHGGPSRQMLLGWHYMDYYAHAYAVNQYWASRGFVVLSVNYRLGVGYGRAFEQPDHAGPAGGAEYQDVLAGARWLQTAPGVDPRRIGIWGGSYGGYLTAMALARNSDVFAAGTDWHGVHDWSRDMAEEIGAPLKRYEQGDWADAMKTAFEASPDSTIDKWRSPVLLIQGDDDRNVRFNQTVDLAGRLTKAGVPFEELVIPNEIHFFLRYQHLLQADTAMARFMTAQLKP